MCLALTGSFWCSQLSQGSLTHLKSQQWNAHSHALPPLHTLTMNADAKRKATLVALKFHLLSVSATFWDSCRLLFSLERQQPEVTDLLFQGEIITQQIWRWVLNYWCAFFFVSAQRCKPKLQVRFRFGENSDRHSLGTTVNKDWGCQFLFGTQAWKKLSSSFSRVWLWSAS